MSSVHINMYRIAGNFGGQNIHGSAILRHFVGKMFVFGTYTAGKGINKVASFVGKIFVVRLSTTNILPHENYPLYGIYYKYMYVNETLNN